MIRLSGKMPIFVPWFRKNPRHRGELLNFDPPENLKSSKYKGEKSESCFSCSSIYTALSLAESVHIYTCRCELISFLLIRVFQRSATKETLSKRNRRKNLLAKECKKAHTLCVNCTSITKRR
jgi:hypothetical protein